jgi:hypothetical protein
MSAIFWTNQRAIAYNGGSGQWTSQSLSSAALGGIASEELGVVWTTQNVYSYSYALRIWKSIAMRNPFVSGSGNTAVSRNSTHAFSYSRTLDTWYPFTPGMCIQGGTADGDVAVVYTKTIAYAFSQFTGNWYPVPLVSAPLRVKAQGNAILVQTNSRVYGFSNLDPQYESWSSCTIQGTVLRFLLDDFTGFLLTTQRIMAFKATATVNRWTVASYTGLPRSQDVQGATAVFWTNTACYATASVWSGWRVLPLNLNEYVQSGGSAGNFGLLWTNTRACAFSSSSGNWMTEPFHNPTWNGLSENGVGMVWNDTKALAFNPLPPNSWIADTLEGGFNDASASGSGTIGALWNGFFAHVYSTTLQTWIDLEAESTLIGGAASGEVAVLWTNEKAYGLCSSEGTWNDIVFDELKKKRGRESPLTDIFTP